MKIACYCRVSTDEQYKHGLSIDTQLDNLREWAKQNHHTIVKEYVDGGVSGKKPYTKRPALSQFVADLENGLQVDALVFCKLDRFFRSVKHYYQIMAVMDKYHVGWQTIHERYETLSSQGQFVVNLMLSLAEAEATRTSERIKVVFERKVQNGEPTGGNSIMPIGYKVVNRQIVTDERATAVKAVYDCYEQTGSVHKAMDCIREEHGLSIAFNTARKMLRNKAYTGEYRGQQNFFPVIIERNQFERVQKMLQSRSTQANKSERVYIFSGLIKCKHCNHACVGVYANGYYYYRCGNAASNRLCANHKHIAEPELEQWLLVNVETALDAAATATLQAQQKKKKVDASAISGKLERLKDLYVDGLITKEQYLTDYNKLQAVLQANIEPPQPDYEATKKIIKETLRPSYAQLSRENKRILWRSIIDHIEVDADGTRELFFK